MITATQLRPGMVIVFNKELHTVFTMSHRTPGNLRGFVQVKMRNLKSGSMFEHRFSSEDKVERAVLEDHEMEYMYDDGDYYYFMDIVTFEQMHFTKDILGDAVNYLIPQLKLNVEFHEGKAIGCIGILRATTGDFGDKEILKTISGLLVIYFLVFMV